jgi:hypothetical protein
LLAGAADPAPSDWFETKIRPVLVEHCYRCHSAQAKSIKGGLRLDTAAGLRKGGDSGPIVVPGKPDSSLLLRALSYRDETLRMPPQKQLPAAVIADFARWIAAGAPYPLDEKTAPPPSQNHWAFQPIRPALPPTRTREPADSPIDAFIRAGLTPRGLSLSPPAPRRTLIRRAYFDLIGLPPTFAEIEAFERDPAPDAFARAIDRLLASPHYGERWGRHWLDVARYADTKDGVLMFGDDRVRPYAYTYRDYVVRAFNEDVPFDRFVHEQLAADLIEPKVEPWRLAALGFLTVGRLFDNNIHDVLDDRIDVVSRGLLGLTVSCARCHDHKYDPIPTADYYSLYGVFAACEAPLELPLLEQPVKPPAVEAQLAAKRKEAQKFLDSQYALLQEAARQRVKDYLIHVATTSPDPLETAIFFLSLRPEDLRPQMVARWRRLLAQQAQPDHPVFGPWHDLMQLSKADFASQAEAVVEQWRDRPRGTGSKQLNSRVWDALKHAHCTSRADVARIYGELLQAVYEESKKASTPRSAEDAQLLALVVGADSPFYFPKGRTREYMSRGEKDQYGGILQELDRVAVKAADAAPRAMVLNDSDEIAEPRIFVRGNPAQPGARVPRQFLAVAGPRRQPVTHGSGRLDLARAITAADNPLTSRVIVNRVWMHHFGEPLVETPSDFGLRCKPPAHPELLDYLAATLQADGWSLKRLHRLIMLSQVYQQASLDRPECRRDDPDNRLLWRMNRRRLDLEAMRDTLLALSGRLVHRLGGRPVDGVGDPANRRRTLYGLVDRQNVPGLYRAFDFASPDQSAERRPQTTVPQQALFGMNAPFMLEQARALLTVPEVIEETNPERRVMALYRRIVGRRPDADEVRLALTFVKAAEDHRPEPARLDPWQQLAQVLLLTNELMFVE